MKAYLNKKKRVYRVKYMPYWHRLREIVWRFKWFRKKNDSCKFHGLISSIDGRMWHGGMCDRFKGIISTYLYCKINNIPFRINYNFPFNLSDYVVPNKYDWRLREGEYSESFFNAEVLNNVGEDKIRYRKSSKRQIHVYANRDYLSQLDIAADWGKLYKELFKPSKKLEQALNNINFGRYIALVYRFQNLLGDFNEYSFTPAVDTEKTRILKKCLDSVENTIKANPDLNILVTSDSKTFLDKVKNMERVKVIPGEVIHIDTKGNEGKTDAYPKSFLDFYVISGAEKVYCPGTKEMYPSQFPMYAAKINGVPFERIIL